MGELAIRASASPFGDIRRDGNRCLPDLISQQIAFTRWQAAWQQLFEDFTTRSLGRPTLVISDGSQGAAAALAAT